ncbi:DNA translocase FtsK 4TM domain-containing protein, partial [Bacteroidota bacterium]
MKKTEKKTKTKEPKKYFVKTKAFFSNRQVQSVLGVFTLLFGVFLAISFMSFFFSWKDDQSLIHQFSDKGEVAKNLLGKIGANLSHFFIYKGFGIAAFMIPFLLMMTGSYLLLLINLKKVFKSLNWGILGMIWIATTFGFTDNDLSLLSGIVGTELNDFLSIYMGKTGLAIFLLFGYLAYAIIRFKITPEKIKTWFPKKEPIVESDIVTKETSNDLIEDSKNNEVETSKEEIPVKEKSEFELSVENLQPTIKNFSSIEKKEEEKSDDD